MCDRQSGVHSLFPFLFLFIFSALFYFNTLCDTQPLNYSISKHRIRPIYSAFDPRRRF